uniref:GNAT family N-acetyltransferase/peptidase C39 family protein n=1 Tax=Ningiella ruwaisensis TaxID=2364274 RepID=UPI001F4FA645|nr:GNAT family N-acetyltransferase/peptidase C39 family protein [Ningiella ruwaisensis]
MQTQFKMTSEDKTSPNVELNTSIPHIRLASIDDIDALLHLENACFSNDRLSKRRFRHWVNAQNAFLIVAEKAVAEKAVAHTALVKKETGALESANDKPASNLLAYALIIMRKGSRSARLYSIAVDEHARGLGLAKKLVLDAEERALASERLFMRLEVATNNTNAIALYEKLGYKRFGTYSAYYEDGADAIRMQKAIKQAHSLASLPDFPWYQQTTPFTCGCASLMMSLRALGFGIALSQETELDIWRQATSIYMTSGHGGTHPIGLALAAMQYSAKAKVIINTQQVPFIDGVRTAHKKALLQTVHQQFVSKAHARGIEIVYSDLDINALKGALDSNKAIICLISTYQFDGKKIPHWVCITHIDDSCLYIHDPDLEHDDNPMDFQHIPIAIDDFLSLSTYGKQKLRSCIIIET